MNDILGLGGVTIDQIGVVDHIPARDEVIRLLEYRSAQGGMVATALTAAARLGGQSAFLGAVGDDANGRLILDGFASSGVKSEAVRVVTGGISAFSFILVEKSSGLRTIIHEPGVQKRAALPRPIPDPDTLLSGVGFLHLDGFWMEDAVVLARAARRSGVVITLDVGQNQRDPKIEQLLALAHYVIPSLAFTRRFTGGKGMEEAAEILLGYGARAVIQTLGERGAYVVEANGGTFSVPAFPVDVVDTTGAGDSFHGGFLFALSRGWELKQATVFASAVAALKCTAPGGQSGLPTFEQTRRFLGKRGVRL